MQKPPFFDDVVREREEFHRGLSNTEYARPVEHLFEQVRNIEYVVSELLQNADDTGANDVTISIENNIFCFTHNGTPFSGEDFRSMCRFAVSNKTSMQTIGFRGIGFKSIFSLGDRVHLVAPALPSGAIQAYFDKSLFTLPHWDTNTPIMNSGTRTTYHVTMTDATKTRITSSLNTWSSSPVSLIFFRHITSLTINGKTCSRTSKAKRSGVDSVEIIIGDKVKRAWKISSKPLDIPADAQAELRELRHIASSDSVLPPVRIDVIFGNIDFTGRFFAVLPTGRAVDMPFSCNAPFRLAPSRDRLEDPGQSTYNAWLLDQTSALVADYILHELGDTSSNIETRALAYRLIPSVVDAKAPGSDMEALRLIEQGVTRRLKDQRIILSATGDLLIPNRAALLPAKIYEIWNTDQLRTTFCPEKELASTAIFESGAAELVARSWIEKRSLDSIKERLGSSSIPRPSNTGTLMRLWSVLQQNPPGYGDTASTWHVIPVQGSPELTSSLKIARIGAAIAKQLGDLAKMIIADIPAVDVDFISLITDSQRDDHDKETREIAGHADALMRRLSMNRDIDGHELIKRYLDTIAPTITREKSIATFAMCFALDVKVPAKLHFFADGGSKNQKRVKYIPSKTPNFDLFPPDIDKNSILPESYYNACNVTDYPMWEAWAVRRAEMYQVPFPIENVTNDFINELKSRGLKITNTPYRSGPTTMIDFVYHDMFHAHWDRQSSGNEKYWAVLLRQLLEHSHGSLNRCVFANIISHSRSNSNSASCQTDAPVSATWVERLRIKKCIATDSGKCVEPAMAYLNNDQTRDIIGIDGVEFVDRALDIAMHRDVLMALGCRSKPPSLSSLAEQARQYEQKTTLDDIQGFALVLRAIEGIYRRRPDAERAEFLHQWKQSVLLPSQNCTWLRPGDLVIGHIDLDGVECVHTAIKNNLVLIDFGIPREPSLDQAKRSFADIPRNVTLDKKEADRIRKRLSSSTTNAELAWNTVHAWLTIADQWRSTADLKYLLYSGRDGLTRDAIVSKDISSQCADFTGFAPDSATFLKNSHLINLGATAQAMPVDKTCLSAPCVSEPWLEAIAEIVHTMGMRAKTAEDNQELETSARRLRVLRIVYTPGLQVVRSLEGTVISQAVKARSLIVGDRLLIDANSRKGLLKITPDVARDIGGLIPDRSLARHIPSWIARSKSDIIDAADDFIHGTIEPWPIEDQIAEMPGGQTDLEANPEEDTAEKIASDAVAPSGIASTSNTGEQKKSTSEIAPDVRTGDTIAVDRTSTNGTSIQKNLPESIESEQSEFSESTPIDDDHDNDASAPENARGLVADHGRKQPGSRSPRRGRRRLRGDIHANEHRSSAGKQGHRMLSYLEHDLQAVEHDTTEAQHERARIGDIAEEFAIAYEKAHGRFPQRMERNNPGWDIASRTIDGGTVDRHIEVKGVAGAWGEKGVFISATQAKACRDLGDRFWLYVIEECFSHPVVHPINNPLAWVDQFCFDAHWVAIACREPVPAVTYTEGMRVTSQGKAGTVTLCQQRGVLWRIQVVFDGDPTKTPRNLSSGSLRPLP